MAKDDTAHQLDLLSRNIAALAARATAIEEWQKNLEGQDGISVKGNKIFLDRKMEPFPLDAFGLDLTVYDTDETTILYTGRDSLYATIDAAGTQKQLFYVKTEFCKASVTYTSFVLRSLIA